MAGAQLLGEAWDVMHLPLQVAAILATYHLVSKHTDRRGTMAYLNRDAIFDADDVEYQDVDVPEWGGTIRIKSITGAQRDAYEQSLIQGRGDNREMNLRHARAKLIVLCAVDESGRPLFSTDDVNRLSRKNAKPVDRLFDACKRIAGLTQEDVDSLVEDFGATQGEPSSIG